MRQYTPLDGKYLFDFDYTIRTASNSHGHIGDVSWREWVEVEVEVEVFRIYALNEDGDVIEEITGDAMKEAIVKYYVDELESSVL